MLGRSRSTFQGTVLIAEDHQVFRMGLIQLLRRALKVKRFLEAACFAQVLEHLQDDDVTLTILDLQMPGLVAPSAITRLRLLRPETHVVVLSGSDAREDILGSLSAGAHGYIVKSDNTDQLIGRLRYILSGEIYVPPVLADLSLLAAEAAEPNPETQFLQKTLSSRQRQVLKGLVEGKSNKQIAKALNISGGTVKNHLVALFRVLGATNRAHAVALGKQLIG